MLRGERSALRCRRWLSQSWSVHSNRRLSHTIAAFLGGFSKKNPYGIGLEADMPARVPDFILVMRPLAHPGNENLPHPGTSPANASGDSARPSR